MSSRLHAGPRSRSRRAVRAVCTFLSRGAGALFIALVSFGLGVVVCGYLTELA